MFFHPFGVSIWLIIVASAFGEQKIQVDKLTTEYITLEKALWKKVDTQLILIDRGSLLNEIYHKHAEFLRQDFGDSRVIGNLGIQKYQPLITTALSIDTNLKNIQDYLTKAEYTKMADLAKNAAGQMQQAANDLNTTIGSSSFWNDLATSMANNQTCQLADVRNSNEFVFDIYKDLSAVSLKSYISIQLTQMILKVTNEADRNLKVISDLRDSYFNSYVHRQVMVKELLKRVSAKKWTCDRMKFPSIYHQITRFIQGFVDNEVNLNDEKSCKQTCSDYTSTKSFGCAEKTLCSEYSHIDEASIRCKGTIYNCDFIDDDVTVCPALQKLNTRRYDYVRFGNGKTLGKYGDCLQTVRAATYRMWFVKCTNCFCYCDEESTQSDRFFSLHDVTSNINENRIVTGVAITKRNRMILFVIGESTLLPYGKLNTTITNAFGDTNVNNRYIGHPEFDIDSAGIKNGIDYHTLTYYKRKINLDTVQAPAGHVITGVRFHALTDGTLTIQARATAFDYKTGQLKNIDKSVWLSPIETVHHELQFDLPDLPTRASAPLQPDWTPNQYIQFQPTDRVKDAAQSTIPFLDGTFVEGNPSLLSGIGLYFKSANLHFGGFIAPYLVAFDFGSLINPVEII